MPEAPATCGACGAVVDTETGGDICPACGSSVLGPESTRGSRSLPGAATAAPAPAPAPAPELSIGLKLVNERFTLVRRLGRGGMGEVWLATDANLRLQSGSVALKFLTPHFRRNAKAMDLLREELEASRQLSHDNILRIHDLHTPPGEPPFILMEYVEGKTLQQIMHNRTGGRFDWEELKPLVTQLCSALQYAHSKRVIHRDLKPGNLLVDESLRLKLADFGLARLAPLASPANATTRIAGTPEFMSPQQMRGQAPSVADDLYALGATLYELLTGTCPLRRGEDFTTRLDTEIPERISARLAALAVEATVPGYVEDAVAACLDKDPARRPSTVASLARRLRLASPSPEEKRAQPAPKPVIRPEEWDVPAPSEPRHRLGWVWSAVLIGGLAVAAWMRFGSPPRPSLAPKGTNVPTTGQVGQTPGAGGPPAVVNPPEAGQRPANGLLVRLHPRWPGAAAEVRFHGPTHGTQVVHRAQSSEPGGRWLATVPGDYVIEAGQPYTEPSSTAWVNLRTNLAPGRACEVMLDYAPPDSWQFTLEGGATVVVKDIWDRTVEMKGPFGDPGKPHWASQKDLRQGEYRLSITKRYRQPIEVVATFDPGSFKPAARPHFAAGPEVQVPVAGLSWTNSLGMVLQWVDGFWAAATETRISEFARFAGTTNLAAEPMVSITREGCKTLDRTWAKPGPGFDLGPDAPVVGVTCDEAERFCGWLTTVEREAGRLDPHQAYRLPTDTEWGRLAREQERSHPFPWGSDFPPPSGDSNYAGKEARSIDYDPYWPVLDENLYSDPYPRTAPAASGQTNRYGLYHVGGNVAEWCASPYQARLNSDDILADDPFLKDDGGGNLYRVVRGGSWYEGSRNPYDLRTAVRRFALPTARSDRIGFRVVLVENLEGHRP